MLRHLLMLAGALALLVGVVPAAAQDTPLNVVATTTQAADLVRIIAGDRVNLTALMGAGVDPHLYQPTEADIRAMNEAQLVVYSGLNLEGQFDTVFASLGERSIRTYALGDSVDAAGFIIRGFAGEAETPDPHFWFDPRNWQIVSEALAGVLGELDPANADAYAANAEAYSAQLDLLYAWALETMSQTPEEQRFLVTSHDAFVYFGDAFGWTVRGLQGISTEDEAGVGDIQSVADFVVENDIPVIFVESSVPPDTIEAVQEAIESRGGEVRLGVRELYSDAMGDADTFGGTFVGMIAENVLTIAQSYQAAGVDLVIPAWPEGLEPAPPAELLEAA